MLKEMMIVEKDPVGEVKRLFALLTDEERDEVMSEYCRYCGRKDPNCQCWNDE